MNDVLPRVRSKIQAAAHVAGGQDRDKLFRFYDKSGDGELQIDELTNAIRRDLKLAPKDVSKDEIEIVFNFLDKDGGGSVDMDELLNFIDPEKYLLEEHPRLVRRRGRAQGRREPLAHQGGRAPPGRRGRRLPRRPHDQQHVVVSGAQEEARHRPGGPRWATSRRRPSPSAKLAPLASSQSAPAIVGFEGFAGFEGFESLSLTT